MTNLRIAGPTPLSPAVYKALSLEMISHRGKLYEELQKRIIEKLRFFFETKERIYLLTSSGTGGMEAAIANFFSPGDKLLSFTGGVFGERWVKIAKAYGANVIETKFPMGKEVDFQTFEAVLKKNPDAQGIMITYCETSATILNDLETLSKIAKKILPEALMLVDAISAMGAAQMKMDEWGIDFVVTGSQKAWGAPPGVCMIAVGSRAFDKMPTARNPRFYFDLSLMEKYGEKNQTPATPAVGSLYGLDAALDQMLAEGAEKIYKRHLMLRDKLRDGLKKMGLTLLCADDIASPSITGVYVPEGIDAKAWLKLLREKYDTVISGGKGELTGKVIRIAHMGYLFEKDIDITLQALKNSLADLKK